MEQTVRYKKISGRFHHTLFSAIEDFRTGNDHQGLDGFINAMDDLESLLEMDQSQGTQELRLDKVLPVLEALSACAENRDITGLTDLLEFTLYPIAKELIGNDEYQNSEAR